MGLPEKVVVIGASAGGLECLKEIVGRLPGDYQAAVFVVLHIPAYKFSSLPKILTEAGT
jgi:two-component system chemotaxis response regulator CheB